MMYTPFPRERRQSAYIERSKTARFYAKLLVPVTLIAVSAAIWSDPVLNPKLTQGLEEIRPIVDAVIAGEPIGDVLASNRPSPVPDSEAEAPEQDPPGPGLQDSPPSVNRPAG